jgi:hypothetical protein
MSDIRHHVGRRSSTGAWWETPSTPGDVFYYYDAVAREVPYGKKQRIGTLLLPPLASLIRARIDHSAAYSVSAKLWVQATDWPADESAVWVTAQLTVGNHVGPVPAGLKSALAGGSLGSLPPGFAPVNRDTARVHLIMPNDTPRGADAMAIALNVVTREDPKPGFERLANTRWLRADVWLDAQYEVDDKIPALSCHHLRITATATAFAEGGTGLPIS